MKAFFALFLPLCLILAGCSQNPPSSSAPPADDISSSAPVEPSSPEASPALQHAQAEKVEILAAIQEKIAQYQAGQVVNDPLEPRFEPFPEGEAYPIVDSVEDFFLEEGNEMFGATAILPLQQHNMYFYLDCYAQSPQDDGVWGVSAVGFSPIQQ